MEFFLCVIGMVMVVEGIPYFAFPDKIKLVLQKMFHTPDTALRRMGLVLMITGLTIVYAARKFF